MISRRAVLGAALAPWALAGCTTLRALQAAAPAPTVHSLDVAFQVNGRFAVRAGKDGGSGRIAWQHSPDSDDLAILSPIGQGLARIVRENGVYTLTTRDDVKQSAADPDDLTERILGWRLPLTGLPYWVRGRPAPAPPPQTRGDANSRLDGLEQAGWTIEYQSYHLDIGMPERIRVSRPNLDLRLVLEEWTRVPVAPVP